MERQSCLISQLVILKRTSGHGLARVHSQHRKKKKCPVDEAAIVCDPVLKQINEFEQREVGIDIVLKIRLRIQPCKCQNCTNINLLVKGNENQFSCQSFAYQNVFSSQLFY